MSLSQIKNIDKEILTPSDVAPFLGCEPYSINVQCKEDPKKLGFPVCVIGTRVRIPKAAFVRWCEGTMGAGDEE